MLKLFMKQFHVFRALAMLGPQNFYASSSASSSRLATPQNFSTDLRIYSYAMQENFLLRNIPHL